MWIRSQDKTKLMNCEYFTVDNANVVIGMVSDNYKSLGTYSTEEKALKVLDILETFIRGDFVTLLDGNYIKKLRDSFMWGMHDAKTFIREMQKQVFQMPQEDEVE